MNKTIIVSNRLPLEFKISSGKLTAKPSVGGLATGLKSVHAAGESLWIGWSGLYEEQLNDVLTQTLQERAREEKCITVPLTKSDFENYYLGLSNKTLWPLFHYFLEYVSYDTNQWEAYKKVNQKFADTVVKHAQPGDKIWIHDYQLLLLPMLIRQMNPALSIGFFLHIPFPSFEIFRTFPWRKELLEGMLGADLIGFHTYDYVQHFLNSVKRIMALDIKFNEIHYQNRILRADSFPMGIDYDGFHQAALKHQNWKEREKSELIRSIETHVTSHKSRRLILSIDRMDYTKGIPNRIKAFDYFLEQYPEYREKVSLIMLVVPSRSNVPQYKKLKKETDELVGRINGKYAVIGWTPIWYFYRSMPFSDLIDLYTSSHIALITPLRDGMNLVAKEYIATRTNGDGVLILSEMAGAANEMQEALIINPNNFHQFAEALHLALEMPLEEQRTRILALQKRLSRYTVSKWALDFMKVFNDSSKNAAIPSKTKWVNQSILDKMVTEFNTAQKKILLLDYDGTLVHLRDNPDKAAPEEELYDLLDEINKNENTNVVIISGRGRESIEKWFGHKKYTLITDHGVWMRKAGKDWEMLEDPKTDWKEIIRPIMDSFVDRTPGTFLEEKQFSLVWHYRKANQNMSEIRMRELKILLTDLVSDNGLTVLEGNKVLEVKNNMVNKGRATSNLILSMRADFVLAAGDDYTDEFMFGALPDNAYSVKVGIAETQAIYYVHDVAALRSLLMNLK